MGKQQKQYLEQIAADKNEAQIFISSAYFVRVLRFLKQLNNCYLFLMSYEAITTELSRHNT
jgi:hypothetical protein